MPSRRVTAGASVNADDSDLVRAIRCLDLEFVADSVADERLAEGGLVAHAPTLRIGLGRPDDAVGLLAFAVLFEADRAAHRDDPIAPGRLDQHMVLDYPLYLSTPPLPLSPPV